MPNGPLLSPTSAELPGPAPDGLPSGPAAETAGTGEPERRPESLDARLLRINLPALMGQRDGAVDTAIALFHGRTDTVENCGPCFRSVAALLALAAADCRRIIGLLSAPDFVQREQRLLAYVQLFTGLNEELCSICRLHDLIFVRAGEFFRSTMAELGEKYAGAVKQRLRESGGMFCGELESGLEHALPRISGYRADAVSSFSAEDLDRYRRAYASVSEEYFPGLEAGVPNFSKSEQSADN